MRKTFSFNAGTQELRVDTGRGGSARGGGGERVGPYAKTIRRQFEPNIALLYRVLARSAMRLRLENITCRRNDHEILVDDFRISIHEMSSYVQAARGEDNGRGRHFSATPACPKFLHLGSTKSYERCGRRVDVVESEWG